MKVVKKASPAAIAVLRQATKLWPKRKKASDGLLPSLAHLKQNPTSDHNTGLAVDITHDPKNGPDCAELFKVLRKDKRVKYLIFNKKIWVRGSGEKKYTGSNPHSNHLHISIRDGHSNDVSPWFAWVEPKKIKKPVLVCTCKTCPVHKKGKK